MSDELKPCPFCGEPFNSPDFRPSFGQWQIICGCCEIQGPLCPTQERAIAAWNRRAEPTPQPVAEAASGLVERLRDLGIRSADQVAAELTRLTTENERLWGALALAEATFVDMGFAENHAALVTVRAALNQEQQP